MSAELVNPVFQKLVITNALLASFLKSVLIESPPGLREAQDSHSRLRDASLELGQELFQVPHQGAMVRSDRSWFPPQELIMVSEHLRTIH